jgi:hypothetical protein
MKIFIAFFALIFTQLYPTEPEQKLIAHVLTSIENAEKNVSKLSPEILKIDGMSSAKVRHFLNNLCSLPGIHYLEIGCWKGSTFVAGLFQNPIASAVAIDNWSEYGGPKDAFDINCYTFLEGYPYHFYGANCFKIDPLSVAPNPIDIYFYDGGHTALDQELAFTYYNGVFAETFIAIVDDWNHPPVSLGTRRAFEKLGYRIAFEKVLPARFNGDTENWWNGLYVAVISKK